MKKWIMISIIIMLAHINYGEEDKLLLLKREYYRLRFSDWSERTLYKYENLIEKLEKELTKAKEYTEVHTLSNLLLQCYENLGEYDKACEIYKKYLLKQMEQKRGEKYAVQNIRKKLYTTYRNKQYTYALGIIDIILTTYAHKPELCIYAEYIRGRCHMDIGNSKQALEILKSIKNKNKPTTKWQEKAHILYAYLLLRENKQIEAIEEFQEFMKKYPESKYCAYAQYSIAWAYKVLGRDAEAIVEYNKLKSNYPESPYTKLGIRDKEEIVERAFRRFEKIEKDLW